MSGLVLKLDVGPGAVLHECAIAMQGVADVLNIETEIVFNGTTLRASPGKNWRQVFERFHYERSLRHAAEPPK